MNSQDFTLIPIEKMTTPKDGDFTIRVNNWWVVKDESLVFYRQTRKHFGFPQCNMNQQLAESVRDRLYPGAEVRQIPVVYIPISW